MLKELVAKWNNSWHYDNWWRERHKVAFNSSQHRSANPIDVKFEFLEEIMIEEARTEYRFQKEKLAHFKKTGQWLRPRDGDDERSRKLFDKIDLSSYGRKED